MTSEQLERANKLKEEIHNLDTFLFTSKRVPKVKILSLKQKYLFKIIPYGAIEEDTYILSKELKYKINELLEDYKTRLENELKNL